MVVVKTSAKIPTSVEKYWRLRQTNEWFSIECKWMNSESKTVLEKKTDEKGRCYFMVSSTRPDLTDVPKWLLNMGPSGGIEFVDTVELDPDNYTVKLKSKPSIFSDACDISSTTRIVGISENECEQFVEAQIIVNSWGVGGIVETLVSSGIKKNYKKLASMVEEFINKYPDHITLLNEKEKEDRLKIQNEKAKEELLEFEKQKKEEAEAVAALVSSKKISSKHSSTKNLEIGGLSRKNTKYMSSVSISDMERQEKLKKLTAIDVENLHLEKVNIEQHHYSKNDDEKDSPNLPLVATGSIGSYKSNCLNIENGMNQLTLMDRIARARQSSSVQISLSFDEEEFFEDAIETYNNDGVKMDYSHTAFLSSLKQPPTKSNTIEGEGKSFALNFILGDEEEEEDGLSISSNSAKGMHPHKNNSHLNSSSSSSNNSLVADNLHQKILKNPLINSDSMVFMFPWPKDLYDLDISNEMIIHIQDMRQCFTKVLSHSMCFNINAWHEILQSSPYRKIESGNLSSVIV